MTQAHRRTTIALALLASMYNSIAQAQVYVNAGETLEEEDLDAGVFQGQSFVLGSDTIFEIQPDATVGLIGFDLNAPAPLEGDEIFYDFAHSTMNMRGGYFFSDSVVASAVENLNLNLYGGTLGEHFLAGQGTQILLDGATIERGLDLYNGASLTVRSGTIRTQLQIHDGSSAEFFDNVLSNGLISVDSGGYLRIHDGIYTSTVSTQQDSLTEIYGGEYQRNQIFRGNAVIHSGHFQFQAFTRGNGHIDFIGGMFDGGIKLIDSSSVGISGGLFGGVSFAGADTIFDLIGTEFFLNGEQIFLESDEILTILDRDVTLSGVLLDGSAFSFDLNSVEVEGFDFFDPAATVRISLSVPAPMSFTPLCIAGLLASKRRRA